MANGIGDEYRRKSTFLGDSDILEWVKEQEDLRRAREREQKIHIIDKIPERIKAKPFTGVEKEQILKGMTLLEIYKRTMQHP